MVINDLFQLLYKFSQIRPTKTKKLMYKFSKAQTCIQYYIFVLNLCQNKPKSTEYFNLVKMHLKYWN